MSHSIDIVARGPPYAFAMAFTRRLGYAAAPTPPATQSPSQAVARPGQSAVTPAPLPPSSSPTPLPEPSAHRLPGRLKAALARSAQALSHRQFDFSMLLYHRSRYGRPVEPLHFRPGVPDETTTAVPGPIDHKAIATSQRLIGEALGKTALDAASAASAATRKQRRAQPVASAIVSNAARRLDTLDSPQALIDFIQSEFACPPEQAFSRDWLASRLLSLAARADVDAPNDPASRPNDRAAARSALVVLALRQAGIDDIVGSHALLDAVGQLAFADPTLDDAPLHAQPSATAHEAQAWRFARLLARSEEGLRMLDALRASVGRRAATDRERLAMRVLLETADVLDPMPAAWPADSTRDYSLAAVRLHARIGRAPLTAAAEGPHALARRAFDAATRLAAHGEDALTDDQRGALFAWRQGFREDGRGSRLSQTRERLHKLAKTMGRVKHKRWLTLLPRMVSGRGAAPLLALQLGPQSVTRKTVARERAALRKGIQVARPKLAGSPALRPAAALERARTQRRAERALVEVAALRHWLERGAHDIDRLDDDDLLAIARKAEQFCREVAEGALQQSSQTQTPGGTGANAKGEETEPTQSELERAVAGWLTLSGDALRRTKPFSAIANRPYTIKRLERIGKRLRIPEEDAFWKSVDTLQGLAYPEVGKPEDNTADSLREALIATVSKLESGQRLRLADGGGQGIGTSGLNLTAKILAHGLAIPVAPRLDARAQRTREAVIEVSRSTHGIELFFGTAKTIERSLGMGLLVGYNFETPLAGVRLGFLANALLHSRARTRARGITLSVTRRLRTDGAGFDDAAMHAKAAQLIDFLFEQAGHADERDANADWNRLARYLSDPDVSVAWVDDTSERRRRGGGIGVTAGASLPGLGGTLPGAPHRGKPAKRIGLRSGPTFTLARETSHLVSEAVRTTGRLRVEQHRITLGRAWQARARGALSVSHPLDPHSTLSVGVFSADMIAATLRLDERSQSAKVQLVREDGRLVHRACVLDCEYVDARNGANGYETAVEANRDALAALFAADAASQGAADPMADAHVRIDAHLADIRANRRPHLTYVVRFRLRAHAARKLDAMSALAAQLGELDPELDARFHAVLDDPDSWILSELKVRERSRRTRSVGPMVVGWLRSATSVTGDREIISENVPFDVQEALDRPPTP